MQTEQNKAYKTVVHVAKIMWAQESMKLELKRESYG